MSNAQQYTYVLNYDPSADIGERHEATCVEFPDVIAYGTESTEAYWMAVDAVRGLIALAEEMGDDIPNPTNSCS